MRILYVHNCYAIDSGEEQAARSLIALLEVNGHEVRPFFKNTETIGEKLSSKIKAFFSGIHNRKAVAEIASVLDDFRPDIVQVQNIYPWFSPSIFPEIKKRGIPVVMRTPNYRLFCPTGLFYDRKKVCELCVTHPLKELNCIIKNCTGERLKSAGYALRNAFARKTKMILDHVDMLIVQTEFARQKFMEHGVSEKKITILPGFINQVPQLADAKTEYFAYIGRISPEKGIHEIIEAARILSDIPFLLVGDYSTMPEISRIIPPNIKLIGYLKGPDLEDIYKNSTALIAPSLWYDSFPNTIIKAMAYAKPVIATNFGTLSSIIDDNINGLLYQKGDIKGLVQKIKLLHINKEISKTLGLAGRNKVTKLYTSEPVYEKLYHVYQQLT